MGKAEDFVKKTNTEIKHVDDLATRAKDPAELSRMVQSYGASNWQHLKQELDDLKKPESGVSKYYTNSKIELDGKGELKHLEFGSGKDKVVYDSPNPAPVEQTAELKAQADKTRQEQADINQYGGIGAPGQRR